MPTMGLDDAEYRQRASAAGKASILLWLVGGLTYVLPALDQHLPPSPRRPRHHRRQPRRAAGALGRLAEGPNPASPEGATPAGAAARGLGRSRGRQAVVVHQPALARRTRGPCCETVEWGRDVGAPWTPPVDPLPWPLRSIQLPPSSRVGGARQSPEGEGPPSGRLPIRVWEPTHESASWTV